MRAQCAHCPWRKSTNPRTDIPNGYCELKHAALKSTLATPGEYNPDQAAMACHESPIGAERTCVGWMAHQLGPGNNIRLRLLQIQGKLEEFVTIGEQHATFEDTLPKDPE